MDFTSFSKQQQYSLKQELRATNERYYISGFAGYNSSTGLTRPIFTLILTVDHHTGKSAPAEDKVRCARSVPAGEKVESTVCAPAEDMTSCAREAPAGEMVESAHCAPAEDLEPRGWKAHTVDQGFHEGKEKGREIDPITPLEDRACVTAKSDKGEGEIGTLVRAN
uniref:Uncharacterized protein n=1 Tax=Timema shepardi TaxID=629360 RepID=A0A7R9AKY9_TIMSH|nr:unnamed protein product [Timema shepardi]